MCCTCSTPSRAFRRPPPRTAPSLEKNNTLPESNWVQEFLQGYPRVYLHKGIFPDAAQGLEKMPYSFVHIDVDLYESTKACLEYFYPQLTPGGILISHDYSILAGVKMAFTEFMRDKRERLIELPTTQCMIVKL